MSFHFFFTEVAEDVAAQESPVRGNIARRSPSLLFDWGSSAQFLFIFFPLGYSIIPTISAKGSNRS